MQQEFIGSIEVYLLASFIATVLGYRYRVYAAGILMMSSLFYSQNLRPFVAGVFQSSCLAKKRVAISTFASLLIIGLGVYFLGYMIPEKSCRWASLLPVAHLHQVCLRTLGSLAIILRI